MNIKKMVRNSSQCILLLVILLFGCAPKGTGVMYSYSKPPTKMASITHYRIGAFGGSGRSYFLYSNDKFVTQLGNGGYHTEILEPGTYEYKTLRRMHNLSLIGPALDSIDNSMAKIEPSQTIEVNAGDELYFKWELIWGGGVEAITMEKTEALKDLEKLRHFEFEDEASKAEEAFDTKTVERKEE